MSENTGYALSALDEKISRSIWLVMTALDDVAYMKLEASTPYDSSAVYKLRSIPDLMEEVVDWLSVVRADNERMEMVRELHVASFKEQLPRPSN